MPIEIGPGKTKGVSPEQHAQARKLAQSRKGHGRNSSGCNTPTLEERLRLDVKLAHEKAANNTLDTLTFKLNQNDLDVLPIITFMLEVYRTTATKKVNGRLLTPVMAAQNRAHKEFSELDPRRIAFAHRVMRTELAHQLNLV